MKNKHLSDVLIGLAASVEDYEYISKNISNKKINRDELKFKIKKYAETLDKTKLLENLKRIANEAYWCINEPFEDLVYSIGILARIYFQEELDKMIVLWKNLDGKYLAKPFEKYCKTIGVSTFRDDEEVIILNEREVEYKITEYKPGIILILDLVSGGGSTAIKIKNIIERNLSPAPRIYFFCIFGTDQTAKMITDNKFDYAYVCLQYPLNTEIKPSRLEWPAFSDLGDRYTSRTKIGVLIETPIDYDQKMYSNRISQYFSRRREEIKEDSIINNQIREFIGELSIIGGAVYAQQEAIYQFELVKNGTKTLKKPTLNGTFALVKLLTNDFPELEKIYNDIIVEEKQGNLQLQSKSINTFLNRGANRGFFYMEDGKIILPSNFFAYFSQVMKPILNDKYAWFKVLNKNAYEAVDKPHVLVARIRDGVI